jgi:uncharacterized protein YqjF (DUF2071 family)
MRWEELLFASWPVSAEVLRPHVPAGLPIDTWGGSAWLTVVALRLTRVRPLRLPLPGGGFTFSQVNVRTYTTLGGKRGIWLLSVDSADRPTVAAARIGFGAPYHHAEVTVAPDADLVRASSQRRGDSPVSFAAAYRPIGAPAPPEAGSLDSFLVNRLSLYGANRLGVLRGDIAHGPWPLQRAAAEVEAGELLGALGIRLPSDPPTLHFVSSIDVIGGPPVRLRGVDSARVPSP